MAIVHAEHRLERRAVAFHRKGWMEVRVGASRFARRTPLALWVILAVAISMSTGCAHERGGTCAASPNECTDPPAAATISYADASPGEQMESPSTSASQAENDGTSSDAASAVSITKAAQTHSSFARGDCACAPKGPPVWGDLGIRLFPYGDHVGSNGEEFNQLFSIDMDFNIWLWQPWDLYLFSDMRFWGQKASPGITNAKQGVFDFSKREFDFFAGAAWNYYGSLEARVFSYSFNNLNRGNSAVAPSGFNDGVGLENRYYIGPEYSELGTADYDVARSSFVSLGYYPAKTMEDALGQQFHPGAFARLYLVWEILGPRFYLFTDDTFILDGAGSPTLFITDSGMAVRPFARIPRLEFRLGSEDVFELRGNDSQTSLYVSLNYIF